MLILTATLLAACAAQPVWLSPALPVPTGDVARAAAVERFAGLLDEIEATAGRYEQEVVKNHTKMRVMNVLAVFTATTGAAIVPAAAHTRTPDVMRPGLTALSISVTATSALLTLLPHAHQYILKEAGYRQQARSVRTDLASLTAACPAPVLLDPAAPIEVLQGCLLQAQRAVAAARSFPEGSPCVPRDAETLTATLARARRAGATP